MFARSKNLFNGARRMFFCCFILLLVGWRSAQTEEYWKWIQRCLLQSFNESAGAALKKWDLSVTPDGFFRLKKYYSSGKQEYFAFHFNRIKNLDYDGTTASGSIIFKTMEDDIIVQTFNDTKGNIDSMATVLRLPVLNMELEELDSLRIIIGNIKRAKQ